MKKIIYLLTICSAISLAACKKEYACSCRKTTQQVHLDSNGDPYATETLEENSVLKITAKKKKAQSECAKDNGTTVNTIDMGNGEQVIQTITINCTR